MMKFPKEYVLQLIENSYAVVDVNSDDFDILYIDVDGEDEDENSCIVFNVPYDDPLCLYADRMEDEIEYYEGTNAFMLKCFSPDGEHVYWLEAQLLVENRPDLSKALSV